jgi:hypothetical protein
MRGMVVMRTLIGVAAVVAACVVVGGAWAAAPPVATIDSGPSSGPQSTANTDPTFTFHADQTGSTFACSRDGGAFVSCNSPLTLHGFGFGTHTFSVHATNSNGTGPNADWTWTVTSPGAPDTVIDTGPGTTTSRDATFTYHATQSPVRYQCSLDGGAFFSCNNNTGFAMHGLTGGQHTLRVAAVNYAGDTDPTPAMWSWSIVPANDNFADAFAITTASGTSRYANFLATKETGEPSQTPDNSDPGGASIWYAWTAPTTGMGVVDTFGSDFDTTLAVFTGSSVGSLTRLARSDDFPSSDPNPATSEVAFPMTAGTTYRIKVDGFSGAQGNTVLHWVMTTWNDNFSSAQVLSGSAGNVAGNNTGATKQPGEPNMVGAANPGGASIWYRWTAPASGSATFSTEHTTFVDTILGVFTGADVAHLTEIGSNDDNPSTGDRTSSVTFTATAGTVYYVAVDGWRGSTTPPEQGSIVLTWHTP